MEAAWLKDSSLKVAQLFWPILHDLGLERSGDFSVHYLFECGIIHCPLQEKARVKLWASRVCRLYIYSIYKFYIYLFPQWKDKHHVQFNVFFQL